MPRAKNGSVSPDGELSEGVKSPGQNSVVQHAITALLEVVQRPIGLTELLDVFGQQIFAIPGVQGCMVNLVTPSGDALETTYISLPGEFGDTHHIYKGLLFRLDQSDANVIAFREEKFLLVSEEDLVKYADTTRVRFERWKMRSMLVVPLTLIHDDGVTQPIGTVMVFSQDQLLDADLAKQVEAIGIVFAAQIQLQWHYHQALEHAKMVEMRHAETQKFITYITEMNSLTSLDEVYSLIGKEFITRFKFDGVALALAENDELAIVHCEFSEPYQYLVPLYEPFRKATRYSLSMRDAASAMVYLNNQRLYIEDAMKIMHLPMSVKDKTLLDLFETTRSLLLVPIRFNKVPIGVMSLLTLGEPMSLSESDIALIELLGSFISTAIRNAQAHGLVEQQNRKIEMLNHDLQDKMLMLDQLSRKDRLTGLNNFGNFEEELKRRTTEYARAGERSSLSMILLDIDHFKRFNDTFGHPAGNQVLQEVALRILKCVRDMDFVARYGGEEFVILLPQCDIGGAAMIAQRICSRIADELFIIDGNPHTMAISGGCGQFLPKESCNDFICRVDAALYVAKRNGRNRIEIAANTL